MPRNRKSNGDINMEAETGGEDHPKFKQTIGQYTTTKIKKRRSQSALTLNSIHFHHKTQLSPQKALQHNYPFAQLHQSIQSQPLPLYFSSPECLSLLLLTLTYTILPPSTTLILFYSKLHLDLSNQLSNTVTQVTTTHDFWIDPTDRCFGYL